MATMVGQDIEAVRALASQMDNQASQIQQIAAQLTNQLESTQWVGNDRERYVSDWNGNHRAALDRVAQALQEASQVARQNAQQQQDASS